MISDVHGRGLSRLRSFSVQRACISIIFLRVSPKRFIAAVEGHGDSSPVRMVIDLVRPIPTIKSKPIADEAGNNLAGGEIPKQSVVEAHELDSDCHPRFYGYLDFISGFLRNMFAVLKHALHDHMDHVINVLQRFGFRGTPG